MALSQDVSGKSWRGLVLRLGENSNEFKEEKDPISQINKCLLVLKRDIKAVNSEVLPYLIQCVEEIPHKAPLYGTLVGLLNVEEPEIGSVAVALLRSGLQAALDTGECNKLRILLRFLSLLTKCNVVDSDSCFEILEAFLLFSFQIINNENKNDNINENEKENDNQFVFQSKSDFFVYCVLMALPFCAHHLSQINSPKLDNILLLIENYFKLRLRNVQSELDVFSFPEELNDELTTQYDYLEDVWQRIIALKEDSWKSECVPAPETHYVENFSSSQKHVLSKLNFNTHSSNFNVQSSNSDVSMTIATTKEEENHSQNIQQQEKEKEKQNKILKRRFDLMNAFPQRMKRMKLFPLSVSENNMKPIDPIIIEDYLQDVLFYLNGCRKECTSFLVNLNIPIKYDHILIEVVFSELLRLPHPKFKLIYYTIVMVDLCKALPGVLPPLILTALNLLFAKITFLDIECRERLVSWMSHHLSNFKFIWPWNQWSFVLKQPLYHPQRVFVSEILEKEVRLSYWENIRKSLETDPKNERMKTLLPPKYEPNFIYQSGKPNVSEEEVKFAKELISQIRSKNPLKDILNWSSTNLLTGLGPTKSIGVIVQCLLYLGSKSYTHTVTALERYGVALLNNIVTDQSSQLLVIKSALSMWKNSSQMSAIAIDKCMAYRIISNLSIVQYVFSPSCVKTFHTSNGVWEILHNAINKTTNKKKDLQKETHALEGKFLASSSLAEKAKRDAETASGMVQTCDSEEARSQALAKAEWAKSKAESLASEAENAQDALISKKTLLSRALQEQQALFRALFESFLSVLGKGYGHFKQIEEEEEEEEEEEKDGVKEGEKEGVSPMEEEDAGEKEKEKEKEKEGQQHEDKSSKDGNGVSKDLENGDEVMEEEEEKENQTKEDEANGKENKVKKYFVDFEKYESFLLSEEEEWRKCTMGHLKSICRYYALEIWPILNELEDLWANEMDEDVIQVILSGLRKPF